MNLEKVTMTDLPEYDSLPLTSDGARSGWGLFGDEDNVGLLNLLTSDRVVRAALLVRTGSVFPLDAPYDAFLPPPSPHRSAPRHNLVHEAGSIHFDDVHDNYYPQVSSQWDSLGHVGYASDSFYNGATEADIVAGRRNTIDHWAKRGIVGRGVLLDVSRALAEAGKEFDPGTGFAIEVEHLEMARRMANVDYQPGDVLILHTGFVSWYLKQPRGIRDSLRQSVTTVGIASSEEMCRYLWNSHAAAIGSDTFAIEAFPPDFDAPYGFMHRILIGQFGMALGELWATSDLASDCARDGIYEFLFVSAPMHVPGGLGSPANALAIK